MAKPLLASVLVLGLATASCSSSHPAPSKAGSTSSSVVVPSGDLGLPRSAYERDLAVIALRRWAVQAARASNAHDFGNTALLDLETKSFQLKAKAQFADDVGRTYRGPVPFTPVGVTPVGTSTRVVEICLAGEGFSVDQAGQTKPSKIYPATVELVQGKLSWRVGSLLLATFSCSGVTVVGYPWAA